MVLQLIMHLLCQHAGLVFVLLVVAELNLNLQGGELDGGLQWHRVRSLQNSLLRLLVQQVKLHRVPAAKRVIFWFGNFTKILNHKFTKEKILIMVYLASTLASL